MHLRPGAEPSRAGVGFFRRSRLLSVAAIIIALNLGGGWLAAQLNLQVWPQHSDIMELLTVASVVVYILAMALPFVPGIEIGLALMLLFGAGGILLVYLCTQAALALSFLLGRLVPARSIAAVFQRLGMHRARQLMVDLDRTPSVQRLQYLTKRVRGGWVRAVLGHRHLALIVALNLPGNALIGGAGGIGMIAGMSRLFAFPRYLLLIAAATTPVPLFLLLTGRC